LKGSTETTDEKEWRSRKCESVHVESAKKRHRKILLPARTRAPARSSPEIPILAILARAPKNGMRAKQVINEVEKWFPELCSLDTSAVYPTSKKGIVDTIARYGRMHLVERGQLYPPSEENPAGTWKITSLGIERVFKEQEGWRPRYVDVDSLIEDEGEANSPHTRETKFP
jgi:hypothetical protein